MLEYAMEVDRFLYELQCEVLNLDQLSLEQFVQKAEGLCGSEMEGHIVGMIKQGIAEYAQERNVLKYAHLLDKLLKIPTFTHLLQGTIAELYTDIFLALLQQRCIKELDELKILRKYWLGTVDPLALARMRQAIFLATAIDIDTGFKPDTTTKIKTYYKNKLKLTDHQIALHFPDRPQPALIQQHRLLQLRLLHSHPLLYPSYPEHRHNYTRIENEHEYMNEQGLAPHESQLYENEGRTGWGEVDSLSDEELPTQRKRLLSEQTRLALRQDQEARKVEQILRRLRDMHPHSCKECGQGLSTRKEAHHKEHVRERMNRLQKRKNKRNVMMSVGEWEGLPAVSVGEYCISLSVNSYELYKCVLCREPFLPLFRNNQWLLTNAARTSPSTLIHHTCLDALTR